MDNIISNIVDRSFLKFGIVPKEFQTTAAISMMSGHDVFVSVPTGSGKTFTYCFLPDMYGTLHSDPESVVIVITPLISLMMDQVDRMKALDVHAAFVGEAQHDQSINEGVMLGKFQVIFMSPEAAMESRWRKMFSSDFYRAHLRAIIIDECHCIEDWYVCTLIS